MTSMKCRSLVCAFGWVFAAAVATGAAAQPPAGGPPQGGQPGQRGRQGGPPQGMAGDPTVDFLAADGAIGPIVRGAPYSGEGQTTVTQTLSDGTHIERTVRAKFYRDSDGRMRREQTILGLGALNASSESLMFTIVDPVARVTYTLNPRTHAGWRSPMPGQDRRGPGGPPPPPPPPPPPDGGRGRRGGPSPGALASPPNWEALGTKQIEGLTATGRRMSMTIPAGQIGNDRPIEVTDERWESADLKVLVFSRHHDPRTGDVEYRLTNVSRAEPPRDLFTAPSDYTIVDAPPPPPPPPPAPRPDLDLPR